MKKINEHAIVRRRANPLGDASRIDFRATADLDFAQIDSRKRIMDSRRHYSRPELVRLLVDRTPASNVRERNAQLDGATRVTFTEEKIIEVV